MVEGCLSPSIEAGGAGGGAGVCARYTNEQNSLIAKLVFCKKLKA